MADLTKHSSLIFLIHFIRSPLFNSVCRCIETANDLVFLLALDVYFSVAAPAQPMWLVDAFWVSPLDIAERQADSQTQIEPLICC